jgi:hypothetical protein
MLRKSILALSASAIIGAATVVPYATLAQLPGPPPSPLAGPPPGGLPGAVVHQLCRVTVAAFVLPQAIAPDVAIRAMAMAGIRTLGRVCRSLYRPRRRRRVWLWQLV